MEVNGPKSLPSTQLSLSSQPVGQPPHCLEHIPRPESNGKVKYEEH